MTIRDDEKRREVLLQEAVIASESLYCREEEEQQDDNNNNNNNNRSNPHIRRRPDQICITFFRSNEEESSSSSCNFLLPLISKNHNTNCNSNATNNNINHCSSSSSTGVEFQIIVDEKNDNEYNDYDIHQNLHQCLLKFVQTGDELISINDYYCQDKYIGDIHYYWYDLIGRITLIISTTSNTTNNNEKESILPLPQLCQTIVLHQPSISSWGYNSSNNNKTNSSNMMMKQQQQKQPNSIKTITTTKDDDDDDDDNDNTELYNDDTFSTSSSSSAGNSSSNEYNNNTIDDSKNMNNIGITFGRYEGYLCIKQISSSSNFWFIPPSRRKNFITNCTDDMDDNNINDDDDDNNNNNTQQYQNNNNNKNEPIIDCNDIVIQINDMICIQNVTINDIQLIIDSSLMKDNYISIITIIATSKQKRWNKIRKNAIAISGGTLCSIGSIIMVTPLHPIGHVMTMGGIGILSTEFEKPKRFITKLFS